MKISTIRNAFIKQTMIVVGIIGVFVAIVWYVDSMNEESDAEINKLKMETDGIVKQVADLTLEYNKVTADMDTYNEIKKKQEDRMLMVNKRELRDVISGSRTKYFTDDLDVKMGEIKPLTGDKYKTPTVFIESSNTTISLNALSDLDILGLVKVLSESFSGIKFTSLKISMAKPVDNASLISIKDTGFTPMVNGKMDFILFGLRNVNQNDNELLNDTGGDSQQQGPAGNQNPNNRRMIRLRRP